MKRTTIKLDNILEMYSKLKKDLEPFKSNTIDGCLINRLANWLIEIGLQTKRGALIKTLESFGGTVLNDSNLDMFCWQIAANYQTLKRGKPHYKFTAFIEPEWSVIKIIEYVPDQELAYKHLSKFLMKILTGSAAGFDFEKVMPMSFMRLLAKAIGFNRKYKWPGKSVMLGGFYIMGKMNRTSDNKYGRIIDFDEYKVTAALKKYNRNIIIARTLRECGNELPCWLCPAGRDFCKYALRRVTQIEEENKCELQPLA